MKDILNVLRNRKRAIANAKENLAIAKMQQKIYEEDGWYSLEAEKSINDAEEELKYWKSYSALRVIIHMILHPVKSDQ